MKLTETLGAARDAITVKRVFAQPYEKDGVTLIAAATVIGGIGGGSGTDATGQAGEGGGFGVIARPAGAYIIKDGRVSWRPTIDPHRVIAMVGLVAITYLLRRRRPRPRSARESRRP